MTDSLPQLAHGLSRADTRRDPAVVVRVTAIAGEILRRHGVDVRSARRAYGWTNMTWLAGGLVIRVAASPGDDDLLREARLATLLPPEVGYPPVVDSGVAEGHAWVLSREVPGVNLSEAWPTLGWQERAGDCGAVGEGRGGPRRRWRKGGSTSPHARPRSPFFAQRPLPTPTPNVLICRPARQPSSI